MNNFSTIALKEPDTIEVFIREEVFYVGDSKNKNNMLSGLKKVMEMDNII